MALMAKLNTFMQRDWREPSRGFTNSSTGSM